VKHKIVLYFASFFLFGFLLAAANASAQTISYRQTNLSGMQSNRGTASIMVTAQSGTISLTKTVSVTVQ
jgi:hypothetical protein